MSRSISQVFYCESYRSARAQIAIDKEEDKEQVDAKQRDGRYLRSPFPGTRNALPGAPMMGLKSRGNASYY